MERWEAKLIGLFVTLVVPFCLTLLPFWVAPWVLAKGKTGERWMCYLMCFGGGIFFGTFLLHMGPEVRAILDTTWLEPNEIGYPMTDLIIGLGFFFVLYLEKIVMRFNKRRLQRKALRKHDQHDHQNQQQMYRRSACSCSGCREGRQCLECVNEALESDSSDIFASRIAIQVKEIENAGSVSRRSSCAKDDEKKPVPEKHDKSKEELESNADDDSHSSSGHDHHVTGSSHHDVRSLILIVALSMHHIFEGLSLGLQTSVSRVFTLLVALMCHEIIISFSLGLQFVKCKYTFKRMLITTSCCSIIMPVGVAIGMIMSEVGAQSTALDIANGVMQAFACGTFIFVTFFEILQEEIDPHDTSIGKVTGAAMGFTVMALMNMIPEELEEEHTETTTMAIVQNYTMAY